MGACLSKNKKKAPAPAQAPSAAPKPREAQPPRPSPPRPPETLTELQARVFRTASFSHLVAVVASAPLFAKVAEQLQDVYRGADALPAHCVNAKQSLIGLVTHVTRVLVQIPDDMGHPGKEAELSRLVLVRGDALRAAQVQK